MSDPLAGARRLIEMIESGQIPAGMTWAEQWDAARDATELLVRAAISAHG